MYTISQLNLLFMGQADDDLMAQLSKILPINKANTVAMMQSSINIQFW